MATPLLFQKKKKLSDYIKPKFVISLCMMCIAPTKYGNDIVKNLLIKPKIIFFIQPSLIQLAG